MSTVSSGRNTSHEGHWCYKPLPLPVNGSGERRTLYVLIITAITMVAEIIAGLWYGSMALLADGWHMGTHVAAFLITLFAYRYARKHADNPAFSFGTGKVNTLGGYTSAVALVVVALVMAAESVARLFEPQAIHFDQAIWVAILGLSVNLISALLLKDHHHHDHDHDHDHHHEHAHEDHNLRAAYMHVLADALTSVLAIAALLGGKYAGLTWLDPLMGIVGALIITRWGIGLMQHSAPVLLDASATDAIKDGIRQVIEHNSNDRITDLHIWRAGGTDYAVIISVHTDEQRTASYYRHLLQSFPQVTHITVEINSHPAAE